MKKYAKKYYPWHLYIILHCFTMVMMTVSARVKLRFLQKMNLFDEPITISGFDSGGDMALQMQVAFSKNFQGIAMFASTWYACAPFGYIFYRAVCGKGTYAVMNGVNAARINARNGFIDPLEYLRDHRIYHWIPMRDELVSPSIREETTTFFTKIGVRRENIYTKLQNTYHIMPTANISDPNCIESQLWSLTFASEGIGTAYCNYNGAFEGLNYLYGNRMARPPSNTRVKLEPLRVFSQAPFMLPGMKPVLDPVGFIYIPALCRRQPCRLHVFLHGCFGSRSRVHHLFIQRSGYLEVAELNNIIMIFPQSIPFEGNDPGCWDVFGATGELYAAKEGLQMSALAKMLETVTGRKF